MLLLIDAGNTRIKWALAETHHAVGEWYAAGSALHAELEKLKHAWSGQTIPNAIISNVAGDAIASDRKSTRLNSSHT